MNNLYHWLKIRKDNQTITTKLEKQRPTQMLYIIQLIVEIASIVVSILDGTKQMLKTHIHVIAIWCNVKNIKLHEINKK